MSSFHPFSDITTSIQEHHSQFLEIFYFSTLLSMVFLLPSGKSVQLFLVIIIPLSFLLPIVVFHLGQRLKSTCLGVFVWQICLWSKKNLCDHNQLSPVEANEDRNAKNIRVSMSTIQFSINNELREPLLEDTT